MQGEASGPHVGRRPPSVLGRYLRFQVPGWILALVVASVLHQSADVPLWAAAVLVLLWIAKDLVLYPWLRSSYEVDTRSPVERLIGKRGTATQALAPAGYVRLHGELWYAEAADADDPISPGSTVEVIKARGLTLTVEEVPLERRRRRTPETGNC